MCCETWKPKQYQAVLTCFENFRESREFNNYAMVYGMALINKRELLKKWERVVGANPQVTVNNKELHETVWLERF